MYLDQLFQDPQSSRRKLPPLLNYNNLAPPAPKTRNTVDDKCECQICLIARMRGHEKINMTSKTGPPPMVAQSPPAKTLAVCSKCWAEIGKGKPHQCLKSTKRENLAGIMKTTSRKSRAAVTCSTLKTIAEESGVSTKGGVVELQSGSRLLPVQIGTPKVKPKVAKFSHENLKKIQTAHNLSDKTML